MEVIFLGTSGVMPTKDRSTTSILVRHRNESILVDCGEGTQRQLNIIGISPTKITKILISHWHGDHVLGLPGFLLTLSNLGYSKTLEIYGPKGTKKYIKNLFRFFIVTSKIKVKIREINREGKFLDTDDLVFSNIKLYHGVPCLGYIIKEKDKRKMNLKYLKRFGLRRDPILGKLQSGKNIKYKGHRILVKQATKLVRGKKIAIILDTVYSPKISKALKNFDLLIAEATHKSELKDKAKEYKHLTAEDAAKIAKKAKVGKLILTHISKRYKSPSSLLKEAKKIFKNTKIAKDFMRV